VTDISNIFYNSNKVSLQFHIKTKFV